MLETGETLLYPIFGYTKVCGLYQYAYYGFTQTHFLIANLTTTVSGEEVTGTERIPLDVTSVSVEQSGQPSEHTIRILFGGKQEYTICATPRVVKVKSQKENFPCFLAHLRSIAKKPELSLREIPGEKIRWQYFNTYIYLMLFMMPLMPLSILVPEMKQGNFGILAEMLDVTPFLLGMCGFLVGPFILLSIPNRFCFGKVLGIVGQDTLFLENRAIPLCDIKEIVYHPRVWLTRGGDRFCYATIAVRAKEGDAELLDVIHFPVYGLRKIRKRNPDIQVRFDKYLWGFLLLPPAVVLVMGLLL